MDKPRNERLSLAIHIFIQQLEIALTQIGQEAIGGLSKQLLTAKTEEEAWIILRQADNNVFSFIKPFLLTSEEEYEEFKTDPVATAEATARANEIFDEFLAETKLIEYKENEDDGEDDGTLQ